MTDIVLATINARHVHASLGLRWLHANLGALAPRATIVEFTSGQPLDAMLETLLAHAPRVLGFGVYVWNVEETTRLVGRVRALLPNTRIVLGGPEVSHELEGQRVVGLADHVVTGPGEVAFARLAATLLDGPAAARALLPKVIAGDELPLDQLVMPYALYDERDCTERFTYVEASRGCPFKCEFCLSALDRTAKPFPLDRLLAELDALHARGARRFKFVDRTFNLKAVTGVAILEFFLERIARAPDDPPFAHFELVPDRLPDALRDPIRRFPPGTLQFEIGIQTFDPVVQALISRRQDDAAAEANLRWLREHTSAHLHVDLIGGLPGETLAGFGRGFDRLHALRPHEIQVGILKRLRGAPIARHTATHGMRYAPDAPCEVLATDAIPFADMQRLKRFAAWWERLGNSARFGRTLALALRDGSPFERFLALSDWLHARTGGAHGIALERRYDLLREWLVGRGEGEGRIDPDEADAALLADFEASGAHGRLAIMARGRTVGDVRTTRAPRGPARSPLRSERAAAER